MKSIKFKSGLLKVDKKTQPELYGIAKSFSRMPIRPGYKIGDLYINPNVLKNTGDYRAICDYLASITDVRRIVCRNCSVCKVYDKNNNEYKISRANTLEECKKLIQEVRKINNEA